MSQFEQGCEFETAIGSNEQALDSFSVEYASDTNQTEASRNGIKAGAIWCVGGVSISLSAGCAYMAYRQGFDIDVIVTSSIYLGVVSGLAGAIGYVNED